MNNKLLGMVLVSSIFTWSSPDIYTYGLTQFLLKEVIVSPEVYESYFKALKAFTTLTIY